MGEAEALEKTEEEDRGNKAKVDDNEDKDSESDYIKDIFADEFNPDGFK